MPNLSIKDVPEAWAEALRQRAVRNHRSLQGELLALVERAVLQDGASEPLRAPLPPAPPRGGGRTVEQIAAELRARHAPPAGTLPLGVDIIRAERDAR